ncbi:glycine-rich cell wall structural protein-like [Olea europaea var. sylvestris]|uniref:glycine-rich cell wall structural protein-like n=1 Tax=Olea europaea var. sylvestris TaxID=158386 RepID=UPI000C1D1D1B|nr:glycine-rich cell wall structural protein-like [Olea europaea var. sylvestris]
MEMWCGGGFSANVGGFSGGVAFVGGGGGGGESGMDMLIGGGFVVENGGLLVVVVVMLTVTVKLGIIGVFGGGGCGGFVGGEVVVVWCGCGDGDGDGDGDGSGAPSDTEHFDRASVRDHSLSSGAGSAAASTLFGNMFHLMMPVRFNVTFLVK